MVAAMEFEGQNLVVRSCCYGVERGFGEEMRRQSICGLYVGGFFGRKARWMGKGWLTQAVDGNTISKP